MRRLRHTRPGQVGQAILLTLLAVSIFMLGALGLAIDASHLYSQRQMAQVAADAAATAAMMSVYGKKNTSAWLNEFGAVDLTCSSSSNLTPCFYARLNGFGAAGNDTVSLTPLDAVPGVPLSDECTPKAVRVTVTRVVDSTLMQLLGTSNATIRAQGTAACVAVDSPVPILVVHPERPGSFRIGGGPTIQVCGGPDKSIQVNSVSLTAVEVNGAANVVNLSKAGKADSGLCDTGTGSAFGVWGGPSTYPRGTCPGPGCGLWVGTTGRYGYPESWIDDPLRDVFPSGVPAPSVVDPPPVSVPNGVDDCPASPPKPCFRYLPGRYTNGIEVKNRYGIFTPGLYWMANDGFHSAANGTLVMCATCAANADTGMGMVVYNTGNGTFDFGSNGSVNLLGPPADSLYRRVIFFQDRASTARSHTLGGGGSISIKGTIYLTNTRATMLSFPAQYQELLLRGNSGSTTSVEGQIIVDTLDAGGNPSITMKIDPANLEQLTKVALVR